MAKSLVAFLPASLWTPLLLDLPCQAFIKLGGDLQLFATASGGDGAKVDNSRLMISKGRLVMVQQWAVRLSTGV